MPSKSLLTARLKQVSRAAVKRAATPLARRWAGRGEGLSIETWGLHHQPGAGLSWQGVALHPLLAQFGSPLHVVNEERLLESFNQFAPGPQEPPSVVAYSYKTNPVAGVLTSLHRAGAWAEVISPYELWLAFKLGVPAERIIYNGPAKSLASIEEAVSRGIFMLNLNSLEELDVFARVAQRLGKRQRVGLRIAAVGGWAGQFGVPIAAGVDAARRVLEVPSLELVGIHGHAGGAMRSAAEVETFVGQLLAFCAELHRATGFRPQVLDVGGSLGVPTVDGLSAQSVRLNQALQVPLKSPQPSATLSPREYSALVRRLVAERARADGHPPPLVVFEPGKALTASAQLLLTSVVGFNLSRPPGYAVLDAGINLAEAVRHEYHQLFAVNRYGEAPARAYALAGPICSPGDVLYRSVDLPELHVGDSLAVMDSGAYLVPFSTSFSFPQPGIVMLEHGRARLIRRAETFDDLQRREV